MSTEYINQVTLECLMNKDTYKKYVATKKKSVVNKKDQKFYRRRILSLTKELLYPEEAAEKQTTTPTPTTTGPTPTPTPTTTGLNLLQNEDGINLSDEDNNDLQVEN